MFMTSDDLKAILAEIGISQADFARLIGVTPRAVALWMAGDREIPGPAEAYARLLRSLPLNLRQVELGRLRERSLTMRNGMYGITFRSSGGGEGYGVLTFEDGLIYGIDIAGVSYDGTYAIQENGLAEILLKVSYPPNVAAVFGMSNPFEWSITVAALMDPKREQAQTTVQTSIGATLTAYYRFMRELPKAA